MNYPTTTSNTETKAETEWGGVYQFGDSFVEDTGKRKGDRIEQAVKIGQGVNQNDENGNGPY